MNSAGRSSGLWLVTAPEPPSRDQSSSDRSQWLLSVQGPGQLQRRPRNGFAPFSLFSLPSCGMGTCRNSRIGLLTSQRKARTFLCRFSRHGQAARLRLRRSGRRHAGCVSATNTPGAEATGLARVRQTEKALVPNLVPNSLDGTEIPLICLIP